MAEFYRYETKNLGINIKPKTALENYEDIVVSIKQGRTQLDKKTAELGIDTETGVVTAHLSEDDTALYKVGTADVQVNIKYRESGERDTSRMSTVNINENLYEKKMTND